MIVRVDKPRKYEIAAAIDALAPWNATHVPNRAMREGYIHGLCPLGR
jgi:hypothetical protein